MDYCLGVDRQALDQVLHLVSVLAPLVQFLLEVVAMLLLLVKLELMVQLQ
jgi:hypothetical protein